MHIRINAYVDAYINTYINTQVYTCTYTHKHTFYVSAVTVLLLPTKWQSVLYKRIL